MEEKLSLEDGKKLVKLARKAIAYYCASGSLYSEKPPSEKFTEKRGVFVTLNTYPEKKLRGCIGLPYPIKELWTAVIEAAVSAAARDTRFPALSSKEVEKVTVEVSVLTPPVKAKKSELPKTIRVGEHGIIVKRGNYSGLLLPQVATEFGWNAEAFLEQTCLKAGLFPDAWKLDDASVKLFTAQVFAEKEPNGKIVEEI